MTERKVLFVYNPKAGKARIKNKPADILDVFAKAKYEVTIYSTQKSGEAVEVDIENKCKAINIRVNGE